MWNYDFAVEAGQIKNVWVIDGTFTVPQTSMLSVLDDGVFPPASTPTPSVTSSVTPTPSVTSSLTPTPSVTSSVTPTPTITPTETPTNTPTPTITPTITPTPTSVYSLGIFNNTTVDVEFSGLTLVGTSYTTTFGTFPLASGEYLYGNIVANSGVEFFAGITDNLSLNYQINVYLNGSIVSSNEPGPGTGTWSIYGPTTINSGSVVTIYLLDY